MRTVAILLIAALAICGYHSEKVVAELQRTHNTKKIAVMLAQTGSADFIGRPEYEVAKALVDQLKASNTMPPGLEFTFHDTGTNIQQAQELYRQIKSSSEYLAIIGPSTSGESLALADLAEADGVPLLSLAASSKIVKPGEENGTRKWVFKFAQNDDLAARRILASIRDAWHGKLVRIYLLYSEDAFGKSGADVFQKNAAGAGLIEVQSRPFPPSMSSPEPFILSMPDDIDALVIWGTAPGPALLVAAGARERPALKVYLSHGNASDEFIRSAGIAAEGVTVVGSRVLIPDRQLVPTNPQDKAILEYQRFWKNNFAGGPNHFGGHAYDAINMSVNVFNKHDIQSRKGFRDAIQNTTAFIGVTGTFSFSPDDHAGLDTNAFATYVVKNNQFELSSR